MNRAQKKKQLSETDRHIADAKGLIARQRRVLEHDWAIYDHTPELDAARRCRPLSRESSTAPPARRRHCRAADDDAEVAAPFEDEPPPAYHEPRAG
jgi:hypothetical protein